MGMPAVLDRPSLQVSEASRSLISHEPGASQDYSVLVERVCDLEFDDYDEKIGERKPSSENIERAIRLLHRAHQVMEAGFPPGFASTTGQGDIRIYWRSDQQDVHLILPADVREAPSLYLRDGDAESYDAGISPVQLASKLSLFSRA